ncbi:hypothetical protein C8A00DRAFT_18631 [Chaetomidium leptoderma]|uniref:Uncharacterized protein n=1 Tax=Chaetomidium leptoderma TaxID=669021 RepID=A0AAN6ZTP6_9PEZI|nr:hypothetical protein C8A00DRAFT_18631 [Chaetomidium leptoderma]
MDGILVEMQRLVETGAKGTEELSSLAARTIAQAGLQADLRCQLTRFRPRVFSRYHGICFERLLDDQMEKNMQDRFGSIHDPVLKMDEVLTPANFKHLAIHADPADGRFAYPVGKKRTEASTIAMQKAESQLDSFWLVFYSELEKHDTGVWQRITAITSSRVVARTPDWVQPAPTKPKTVVAAAVDDDAHSPFGLLNISSEGKGKIALLREASEKKEKVKTRGTADPSRAEEGQEKDEDEEPAPPPEATFRVSGRVMNIVHVLFPHPSEHNHPGEVLWSEFVHAMAAIGFATTRLFGSAWAFTPTGEEITLLSAQSIAIHMPHPGAKLRFEAARRIGRRLTRIYRLDASSFEKD